MPNLPEDPCKSAILAAGKGLLSFQEADRLHEALRSQLAEAKTPEAREAVKANLNELMRTHFEGQSIIARNKFINDSKAFSFNDRVRAANGTKAKLKVFKDLAVRFVNHVQDTEAQATKGFDHDLMREIPQPYRRDLMKGKWDVDIATFQLSGMKSESLAHIQDPAVKAAIQKYGRITADNRSQWIDRAQVSGAKIKDRENYQGQQSYDPAKMQQAGGWTNKFQSWKKGGRDAAFEAFFPKFAAAFDLEKAYPGLNAVEQKANVGKWFDEQISGRHTGPDKVSEEMNAKWDDADPLKRFLEGSNVAARISKARTFEPRQGKAKEWVAFNKEFGEGDGTMYENHRSRIGDVAVAAAKMEAMGTSPLSFYEKVRDTALNENSRDKDFVHGMEANSRVDNMFQHALGQLSIPQGARGLFADAGIRALGIAQRTAKLPFSFAAHLSGFVGAPVELVRRGVPLPEALSTMFGRESALRVMDQFKDGNILNPLRWLKEKMPKDDYDEWRLMMQGAAEGHNAQMYDAMTPSTFMAKAESNIDRAYSALTLRSLVLNRARDMGVRGYSTWLGSLKDREFGALPQKVQDTLNRYNVSQAEWNAIRKTISANRYGTQVLNPYHGIGGMNEEATAAMLADLGKKNTTNNQLRAKYDLMSKFNQMFSEIQDRSVFSPALEERAMAMGDTRAGGVNRVARQLFWQFRLPILKLTRTMFGESTATTETGYVAEMAAIAAGLTFMQMIGGTIRSVGHNQEPRSWADPDAWADAMLHADAFGIWGTMLTKAGVPETRPHSGAQWAGLVAGNIPGELVNMAEILAGLNSRNPYDQQKAKHQLVEEGRQNLPFNTMFGINEAFKYLLWDNLHDMITPGYADKKNAMWEETNQRKRLINY